MAVIFVKNKSCQLDCHDAHKTRTKHKTQKRARARGVPEGCPRYRAHAALVAFVSKHASSPFLEAVRMAATSLSRNSISDGRLSNLSCSWKNQKHGQKKVKKQNKTKQKDAREKRKKGRTAFRGRALQATVDCLKLGCSRQNETKPIQTKLK